MSQRQKVVSKWCLKVCSISKSIVRSTFTDSTSTNGTSSNGGSNTDTIKLVLEIGVPVVSIAAGILAIVIIVLKRYGLFKYVHSKHISYIHRRDEKKKKKPPGDPYKAATIAVIASI